MLTILPVKAVIRKTGSVPNRVASAPKASVGRPIGSLRNNG